jgi:hypothetical protein
MRSQIIYVNMSVFRNFKPHLACLPRKIYVDSVKDITDDRGVSHYVSVKHDVSEGSIPAPSEYKLETLLSAGIPLNAVSSLLVDSAPSDAQVDAIVNKVVPEDEQVTNE